VIFAIDAVQLLLPVYEPSYRRYERDDDGGSSTIPIIREKAYANRPFLRSAAIFL